MRKINYIVLAITFFLVFIFILFLQSKKETKKTAPPQVMIAVTAAPTVTPSKIIYPTQVIPTVGIPTSTPDPTQASIINSPTPIPLNTPAPPPDSTAPTIQLSGPSEGSMLTSGNFCFLISLSDNSTGLVSRNRLDSGSWTDWGSSLSQYNPCFQNVAGGSHTFNVEAKDQTENTSVQSRSFTITIAGQ